MHSAHESWESATLTLRLASQSVITEHTHSENQLVYASTGVMSVSTEAGTWVAPENRAIWVPAGCRHRHRAFGPTTLHGVGLTVTSNPLGVDGPAVVEVSPLLRELIIHHTDSHSTRDETRRRRLIDVLVDQLEVCVQQPFRLPAPSDPRLSAACRHVTEHLATTVDLNDLARACHCSSRTLSRLFRDEMHMSYVQWRTQLRLYHALRMLAVGESVAFVAHSCGWQTTSAFVDVFHRSYGRTPGGCHASSGTAALVGSP